jgi:hypothetical protein
VEGGTNLAGVQRGYNKFVKYASFITNNLGQLILKEATPLLLYAPIKRVSTIIDLVRDSSAVRRLFIRLAGAVGCRSTLHK